MIKKSYSKKIDKALLLNNDSIIKSKSTGNCFIIFHDKRGWWKYPCGGYSTRGASPSFYKSLSEFIEKELFFDYEIIKE
jgi:hypothetical protein